MICPACKAEIADGVEICFYCASHVNDVEAITEVATNNENQMSKIRDDLQVPLSALLMYSLSILSVLIGLYNYMVFLSNDFLLLMPTNYFTGFIALGIFFALIGSTIVIIDTIKSLKK